MSEIDRILDFWLNDVGPDGWYEQSDAVDARIEQDFQPLWHRAMAGEFRDWQVTARGTLAFLILTDQFSRNMFRGTANAFASDALARRVAKSAIARKLDQHIPEPERQFFFLPLMHSEVLADQEACVCMFLTRMPQTGSDQVGFAIDHRAVIRKFGRFPSRNNALGRTYCDAELAYRADGGYMS